MEQRSIYDFIRENVNLSGEICHDCYLDDYVKNVFGKDFEYTDENKYRDLDSFDLFDLDSTNVKNFQFRLKSLISQTIKTLNSDALEKYLIDNPYKFRFERKMMLEEIGSSIKDVNPKDALNFCKECMKNTKNPYCMYIYILMVSFLDFKEDAELQKIILFTALIPEFTLIINDYLVEKFEYPEYTRFYLAKRVREYGLGLVLQIPTYSDEIKKWIILKGASKSSTNDEVCTAINKIDLLQILKKWDIDFTLYKAISSLIFSISLDIKYSPMVENWEEILIEYIQKYPNYNFDAELFNKNIFTLSNILETDQIDESTKKHLSQVFYENMVNNELIDRLKKHLDDANTPRHVLSETYDAIETLNIPELCLKMYNIYDSDPVSKVYIINHLKNNKEIYEKALEKLYDCINWDELYGEFNNVEDIYADRDLVDRIIDFVRTSNKNLAIKVYAQTIKAKELRYRNSTAECISHMDFTTPDCDKELYEKLMDSLHYTYKNELNTAVKKKIASILNIKDVVPSNKSLSQIFRERDVENSLNLVGMHDEEIKQQIKEAEQLKEVEMKNEKINLNSHLFGKLDFEQSGKGIDVLASNRLIFVEFLKNEVFAFCQGDEFGKEYTIKLYHDDDFYLTEATCTCGKSKKNDYCKHILGLFIYLSKLYDSKNTYPTI